ncbi:MAG: hypothetical protein ABIQ09_12770 [Jatrophihabitantaceae bacterium]
MSEPTTPDQHDPAAEDDIRQHAQADTEGGDATADDGADVPREHTEDPAEG